MLLLYVTLKSDAAIAVPAGLLNYLMWWTTVRQTPESSIIERKLEICALILTSSSVISMQNTTGSLRISPPDNELCTCDWLTLLMTSLLKTHSLRAPQLDRIQVQSETGDKSKLLPGFPWVHVHHHPLNMHRALYRKKYTPYSLTVVTVTDI